MNANTPRHAVIITAATLPLALMLLSGCSQPVAAPRPDEITGRYIAVMCDADMTWSAFDTGALGEKNGQQDSLTVISLPLAPPPDEVSPTWKTTVAQAPVSNSAMGPPVSMAVSADGNRAFICETRGAAPAGATKLDELPVGAMVSAVDLSDPAQPRVLDQKRVGSEPTGCDVHPAGAFVAVVTRDPNGQLAIIPTSAESPLGDPMQWVLLGLRQGARPTCVQWHPCGRYLAVTVPESNQVAFYEFTPDGNGGKPGLAPWGEPVTVGKYPASGRFTPDGRYFITSDLQWGADVEGFMAGAPEGQLSCVALSAQPTALTSEGELDNSRVVHSVVSTATVGISPESMAISPDGNFVVTANLKGSYLGEANAHHTVGGSLSLLRLSDGELVPLGDFPLNAMPEGIAFDASGNHLVVSAFRSFDPRALDGELAFFKLARGSNPRLIPADFHVGVGRGPHGVLIVR
jgi:DNA-binding beta-propeller fold protein YncE